jgi:hypothetical protein
MRKEKLAIMLPSPFRAGEQAQDSALNLKQRRHYCMNSEHLSLISLNPPPPPQKQKGWLGGGGGGGRGTHTKDCSYPRA